MPRWKADAPHGRRDRHGSADAGVAHVCRHGDHIVASRALYGGTFSQFAVTFAQFGIDTSFVDSDDPENFRSAVKANTKALYVETIGNPQLNVADLSAIAQIAHAAGIPLVVDNTLASPYLCRPLEHGADIVIHSVTKYLGGHGTTMGGVLVESGNSSVDNGNFPQMTELARLSRVRFHESFGDFGFTMKARMETMRTWVPRWHRSPPSCCCRASRRCTFACRGIARPLSRLRSTWPRIRQSSG